ncbi:MAG: hypothetical protein JW910_11020 [Anaerolineae bacterium]|nr:hypothetical protein [Anaerolineae bacterium]
MAAGSCWGRPLTARRPRCGTCPLRVLRRRCRSGGRAGA